MENPAIRIFHEFTFSGQCQYRYFGFDTYSGTIGLQDVGPYRGRPAAPVRL